MKLRVALICKTILPTLALACAGVSRQGESVFIGGEETIILWDAENHTEHFIRDATFVGTGADFAFLVPTPSKPDLVECQPLAFTTVHQMVAPTWSGGMGGGGFGGGLGGGRPVEVVQVRNVAGYVATTLRASDERSLRTWLAENGYIIRESMTRWVAPYVRMRWTITAFKIDRKIDGKPMHTTPIRLSFKTREPIYPYREPEDQNAGRPDSNRVLRLYVFSQVPMDAFLTDYRQYSPWRTAPVDSKVQPGQTRDLALAIHLPVDFVSSTCRHLAYYVDGRTTRPDYDLAFHTSIDSVSGSGAIGRSEGSSLRN